MASPAAAHSVFPGSRGRAATRTHALWPELSVAVQALMSELQRARFRPVLDLHETDARLGAQ